MVAQWPAEERHNFLVAATQTVYDLAATVSCSDRTAVLQTPYTYFEVSIEAGSVLDAVSVGLAASDLHTQGQHVGWEARCIGLLGDDGRAYCEVGLGKAFAATFGAGDTVGCYAELATRLVVFVLNGEPIMKNANIRGVDVRPLTPAVYSHGNTRVRANFGGPNSPPFVFRGLDRFAASSSISFFVFVFAICR